MGVPGISDLLCLKWSGALGPLGILGIALDSSLGALVSAHVNALVASFPKVLVTSVAR